MRRVSRVKIGLFCGSVGDHSTNAALLQVAASRIKQVGHSNATINGLREISCFDPALVDDPPKAVNDFRLQLRSVDALLIAAPEYAAGVAGSTKNALDWLVGDSTLYRKPIGVASAGTTGGTQAIEQLVRTISWHGGWVVATTGIAAVRTKVDDQGSIVDETTKTQINDWADLVVDAVAGSAADRARLVSSVVTPYGIDPARFGSFD